MPIPFWNTLKVKNREMLQNTTGLSASASLGLGGFTGGAKIKLFNEHSFNSHTYYLIARVGVRNQSEVLGTFSLVPMAKDLLATDPKKFFQVCGDSFIAARVTGGEFLAIMRLETSTVKEKSELSKSFKAAYTSLGRAGAESTSTVNKNV